MFLGTCSRRSHKIKPNWKMSVWKFNSSRTAEPEWSLRCFDPQFWRYLSIGTLKIVFRAVEPVEHCCFICSDTHRMQVECTDDQALTGYLNDSFYELPCPNFSDQPGDGHA